MIAPDNPENGELLRRQRIHDLRAARLVSATLPGNAQLVARMRGAIRGTDATEISEIETRPGPAQNAWHRAGMVFALTRLVTGKSRVLAFFEIGTDVLAMETLIVRELGEPHRGEASDSLSWTTILDRLPRPLGLKYLQMAGGVGQGAALDHAEPAALAGELKIKLAAVLEEFRNAAAKTANDDDAANCLIDTVLVRRTKDWPFQDTAAMIAQKVLRPVTEILAGPDVGALADVVEKVADLAPLRYAYDLIVVKADARAGSASPHTVELIPAGAAALPGNLPVRTVPLSPVKEHSAPVLALPIVARASPALDLAEVKDLSAERPLIAMPGLNARTGGSLRLRVELSRRGQLTATGSPYPVLPDAGTCGWPEVVQSLPQRLWSVAGMAEGRLDLALLVELGGAEQQNFRDVKKRMTLVRSVVRRLQNVPEIRIAVIGYREHMVNHAQDLIVGSLEGLGTYAELQAVLKRTELWRPVPMTYPVVAPVEDALAVIESPEWNWRPDARHVAVIIGRRPPFPKNKSVRGIRFPCTNSACDPWETTLSRLRAQHALECLAVIDEKPAAGYATQAWQELSTLLPYRLTRATGPDLLLRDCGLTRVELPLAALEAVR